MNKDFTYFYTKFRKNFGKQPIFTEAPEVMLDSIYPDKLEQKQYCLRNPVHNSAQASVPIAERDVNTKRVVPRNFGVNHAEGGWPKDINYDDEELTARHRRKVEREDTYVDVVLRTYPKLNYYVDQNNSIEMYNLYFKEMKPVQPVERSSIRVSNVFLDPDKRPISSIGWTYEEDSKLVVSYCNKMYPVTGSLNKNLMCYVWDVENPNQPCAEFLPPSACWQAVCHPGEPNTIIGGINDGRVCVFDFRSGNKHTLISPMHVAHRDPVSALLFIPSRINNEFFSGSSDGQCMWWDIRNLAEPTDSLIMSVSIQPEQSFSLANAKGVSSLQYDRSFPTKFLCGTDTGLVINVNRKGKTHNEVMSAVFKAHNGPVKAVHRSPCTSKVFLTCGDWTAHIWSDDVHVAPIVTGTAHRQQITDVVWAPHRVSSYMSVCADGKFRYWDLLRKYREPTYTFPVSNHQLLKLVPNEAGQHVAVGDIKGALYMLSLSESLFLPGPKDKQLMIQCLDREGRREHILESRVKEIKLMKVKSAGKLSLDSTPILTDEQLKTVEAEYKTVIAEEIRQKSIKYSTGSGRGSRHRLRTR